MTIQINFLFTIVLDKSEKISVMLYTTISKPREMFKTKPVEFNNRNCDI